MLLAFPNPPPPLPPPTLYQTPLWYNAYFSQTPRTPVPKHHLGMAITLQKLCPCTKKAILRLYFDLIKPPTLLRKKCHLEIALPIILFDEASPEHPNAARPDCVFITKYEHCTPVSKTPS